MFKGVGDLLSLASANAFKGDAVSTVRCGGGMPSKPLGKHAMAQITKLRSLGCRAHCAPST